MRQFDEDGKMKYRMADIIDSLEFDELVSMRRDVRSGGVNLKKLLDSKIREQEKRHQEYCSNCSSELNPQNTNNFTIIFGPDDFRKKASFCGMDCLEYFLAELKELKKVK